MDPTNTVDPTAPPPPPQPPRSSFSCDRHPVEQFSGFCPACLCERLTTLDISSSNTPSTSRRPSSVSAAIKSLFSSSKPDDFPPLPPPPPKPSRPTSFFPELRRTKSYSSSKNEALGFSFEPQRKSCDVRPRNNLSYNGEKRAGSNSSTGDLNYDKPSADLASASSSSHQNLQSSIKIESSVANKPVFEDTEPEECHKDPETTEDGIVAFVDVDEDDEIKPIPDSHMVKKLVEEVESNEIVEEDVVNLSNLKPMKDYIDLESQEKKSSGGAGLWAAASVFSKKWHKWRRKQKIKKQNNGKNVATLLMEKRISRKYRETQSEVADYGFGRRSCDTAPRFSLDAGRISFDDPRYSVDKPRASWDGYMVAKSFPRMAPMVSVMEDAPPKHKPRNDAQIPVEESNLNCVNGNEDEPGGSVQTREYYDSTSRRRKSLDRSSSVRKTAAAVIDELKMVSDAKVSPTNNDSFHGEKVWVGERDSRDSNSISLRDDYSETFELDNGFKDSSNSVLGCEEKKDSKKSRRWSWRIWDFIHHRYVGSKDDGEDENYSRGNGVERSLSESWQDSKRGGNGDLRGGFNRNMFRSNSSVSWRNANHFGKLFESVRKSGDDMNGNGKKRKDAYSLEKNRSARYSSNYVNNWKPNNSLSIARNVLRLY